MHRTEPSYKPPRQPPVASAFSVESALFSPLSPDSTYAQFAPLHYEARYAYPLIVWLHGQGSDERQLMRVMPLVSMRNYVAVAPRGACIAGAGGARRESFGWQQSEDHIQHAEEGIFGSIESVKKKLHVSPRRVFLAGFDAGGTMAFRVAMNHPSRFAGVLSLCGAFPSSGTPLGHLVEARRLSVLFAVGRRSRQYPSAKVCQDLRLFHAAGLSVTLRQYPCGHELARQMLIDTNRWIIEQVASAEGSAVESNR